MALSAFCSDTCMLSEVVNVTFSAPSHGMDLTTSHDTVQDVNPVISNVLFGTKKHPTAWFRNFHSICLFFSMSPGPLLGLYIDCWTRIACSSEQGHSGLNFRVCMIFKPNKPMSWIADYSRLCRKLICRKGKSEVSHLLQMVCYMSRCVNLWLESKKYSDVWTSLP